MAEMNNLVKKKEGELSLITWMKNRVDRNENVNLFSSGQTGSGKTYAQIQMAVELDPDFDPTRQIVFSFKQLMTLLKDPWFMAKPYKTVIFEEFQISQNARSWYDKVNKLLNYLLSTYRHRNVILLINAPYMDFIDSQTKRLFHMEVEMKGKNLRRNLAMVRPKVLQWVPSKKDFYYHSLFVIDEGGFYEKTPYYLIKKPPEHICKIYEGMKTAFTNKLNASIEKELDGMEEKKSTDPKKCLNPDSMQPLLWEVAQQGWRIQTDVEKEAGRRLGRVLSHAQFHRNVLSMRKKGYDIRDFKNSEK